MLSLFVHKCTGGYIHVCTTAFVSHSFMALQRQAMCGSVFLT